jgi:hypothetical protein
MEEKYEYKRLKILEQIKSESSGYDEYTGALVFHNEGEIASAMFKHFGGYIYVRKGYGEKYYDQNDYYYLPEWFLPDADPVIDNLFENLLEGI